MDNGMNANTITFQLATHSLSRIALRMERLFQTIQDACSETHEVIHRYALKNIIELMECIEKPELKSRFIKEFIRIEHVLNKQNILQPLALSHQLSQQIQILNNVPGFFSQALQEDGFLKVLRQIHQPHTKECEFNSPFLVLWFDAPPQVRQKKILEWVQHLQNLEATVKLYLALLRHTAKYMSIKAHNGFFQHHIPPHSSQHLILLRMQKSQGVTPKLQLGHHNLTIRLYKSNSTEEIKDTSLDMEIAFCQI